MPTKKTEDTSNANTSKLASLVFNRDKPLPHHTPSIRVLISFAKTRFLGGLHCESRSTFFLWRFSFKANDVRDKKL